MAASAWLRPELPSVPQPTAPAPSKVDDVALPAGFTPELYRRISSALEMDLSRVSSMSSDIFEMDPVRCFTVNLSDSTGTLRTARVCSIEDVHSRIKSEMALGSSASVTITFGGELVQDDGTTFHECCAESGATFFVTSE